MWKFGKLMKPSLNMTRTLISATLKKENWILSTD